MVQRAVGKKNGWLRNRFLSFMGVVEDEDNYNSIDEHSRYVTCLFHFLFFLLLCICKTVKHDLVHLAGFVNLHVLSFDVLQLIFHLQSLRIACNNILPITLYCDRCTLTCSLCHTENPTIPYIASCGHCYCYLCLRMAVMDDLYFHCVFCGKSIASSGRPTFPIVS